MDCEKCWYEDGVKRPAIIEVRTEKFWEKLCRDHAEPYDLGVGRGQYLFDSEYKTEIRTRVEKTWDMHNVREEANDILAEISLWPDRKREMLLSVLDIVVKEGKGITQLQQIARMRANCQWEQGQPRTFLQDKKSKSPTKVDQKTLDELEGML